MALFVALLVTLSGAACGKKDPYSMGPPLKLDANWSVADSLKIFNAAVKILVTDGKPNEKYYQLVDTVTSGEVKAHILEATDWAIKIGVNNVVSSNPTLPRVLSAGLVTKTTDCVVAHVTVDFSTQRSNRVAAVNPKLASYFALFRRDPAGPDPLKLNPQGWRWEQFIREETGADERAVKIQKKLNGEPVIERGKAPLNSCHATAGLADDCLPPAPNPPVGVTNDLGKAVVAFLACPVPDRTDPVRSPFSVLRTTTTIATTGGP
jgi:hypothetical protein